MKRRSFLFVLFGLATTRSVIAKSSYEADMEVINKKIESDIRLTAGGSFIPAEARSWIMPAEIRYVSGVKGKDGFWPLFEIEPGWIKKVSFS